MVCWFYTDDRKWNTKIATNKADRASKYDDLRAHYKSKYSSPTGLESGVANNANNNNSGSAATTGTNNNSSRWY
jgi:hypothetical protein